MAQRSTRGSGFCRYAVLICLLFSTGLLGVATLVYPGGSLSDANSEGFDWGTNFFSNLFNDQALNGMYNTSRPWALAGMVFHSLAYGLFFFHAAQKLPSRHAATVLRVIGVVYVFVHFGIATPLHDAMVTLSSTVAMLGLFYLTVFIFRTRLHRLKVFCLLCMLTFYATLFLYGMGNWGLLAVMQKASFIGSMALVLWIEYFTRTSDFVRVEKMAVSK